MPYRICKTIEVENGHMLSKHPGPCKFPHGHSRQVELVLEADKLDKNDMVCDFGVIKTALKDFLDTFDHSMCINTDDPMFKTLKEAYGDRIIPFKKTDPTTEVVARMIFDKVRASLAEYAKRKDKPFPFSKSVRLVNVRVWETSTSWAEYGE
jgi:6-pyruvoyltetrahydropterin/6-carboxytetrahydropterin synthase